MLFENNIVQIRAVEPEDLELLYKWENNPQLWSVGNTRNPYSKFALKQYILNSSSDLYENKQLRLMMVCKQTGATVGTVDLFDFDIHNSKIALGLFVDESFQGNGFAKYSLQLVEEYVFEYLKLNQLYMHISANNSASTNMFEKLNYNKTAYLQQWIKTIDGYEDIVLFQLFLTDYLQKKTASH